LELTWDGIRSKLSDWEGYYGIEIDRVGDFPSELEFAVMHAMEAPDGAVFLELGSCHGRTLAALAMVADAKGGMAIGCDDFRLTGCAKDIEDLMSAHGIKNYKIHTSNTHDLPWNCPVDLLIVDGGHDEFNVSRDIKKYLPFVKSGGVVMFHDYDNPYIPTSAHEAIRRNADAACVNDEWIDLGQCHGLKGFKKK
jgi:hypothetical protein